MKKSILFLLFSAMLLVSCSKDDETTPTDNLTYLTISTTRTTDVNIAQSSSDVNPFAYNTVVSINTPEIAAYSSRIKTLEILELKFKVTDFTGDVNGAITGTISLDGTVVHTFTNQNVYTLNQNMTEIVINNLQLLNNVAAKLKLNQDVAIDFSGNSNNPADAMHFNLKTLIKYKIGV